MDRRARLVAIITAAVVVVATAAIGALGSPVAGLLRPRPVGGYRAFYEISDVTGGEQSLRTEIVEVRRPFDARVERRPGPAPGGEIESGQVSNEDYSWQLDEGGELQFGWRRPPRGPGRDVIYAALVDAVDAGVVDAIGRGSFENRACTWFATADPFGDDLERPTKDSRVETCVDPTGVPLFEQWLIDGRVARSTRLVSLDTVPPSKKRFLVGKRPTEKNVSQPEALGLLAAQYVVADDVDIKKPPLRLDKPSGWKTQRKSVVVESAPGGGSPSQFAATSYSNGTDLVVVEVGVRRDVDPTWDPDEGRPVPFGDHVGRLVYFADRIELRIKTDHGFARIVGPSKARVLEFSTRLD